MIKTPSDAETIQQHFRQLDALLLDVVVNLSHAGDPNVSKVAQDVKHISQSLLFLEKRVSEQTNLKQSQLGALMRVGHAINSSLGLKQALEEVMDSLVALTRAERGFLMLREPSGELSVRLARGLDHVNLEEEEFKVSRTVVGE
ncbi:MAG TPA: hypothetical protein VLE49_08200, partial [Anaerolineales bacterium]|nr:hypothetical protein [Anaerolineales bacterium]